MASLSKLPGFWVSFCFLQKHRTLRTGSYKVQCFQTCAQGTAIMTCPAACGPQLTRPSPDLLKFTLHRGALAVIFKNRIRTLKLYSSLKDKAHFWCKIFISSVSRMSAVLSYSTLAAGNSCLLQLSTWDGCFLLNKFKKKLKKLFCHYK